MRVDEAWTSTCEIGHGRRRPGAVDGDGWNNSGGWITVRFYIFKDPICIVVRHRRCRNKMGIGVQPRSHRRHEPEYHSSTAGPFHFQAAGVSADSLSSVAQHYLSFGFLV